MKNKKDIADINIRYKTPERYLHNTNGITLIALVTTIIIMMIFTTVTVYTGFEIYENMKVENFVAKMIVVQEAVDKLCEKYTVSEINAMANSAPNETVLKQVIMQGQADELNCWYDVDDIQTNYKYFDINSINTILGIKDFDTAIWLNPISRNVIAAKGVEYEEKMYYRQYDLPDGQNLPTPNVNVDFTLQYSVKTYDNKAEIILYKLGEADLVETIFSQVKLYKQKEGSTEYSDARIFNNVSRITLNESGIYKVEATDLTKNTQAQENISLTIVNEPLLVDGMTPVKFIDKDNDGIAEMVDTTLDDEDWYNYGENTKQWANAKLKDGSVYVWIPRFAYEIDAENQKINIKFLKEFSQITTDGKSLTSKYKVAPVFQDGTQNSFANGEWNNKITGFWVAKYETTENSGKPKNVLIDKEAWRTITPEDAFNVCRKMEADYKSIYFGDNVSAASGTYSYGAYKTDENNIDTHLMKNSEWGAVAYLTHSKYGCGASNVAKAGSYYIKNSADEGNSAPEYSSTNNYTGIYGLNGGANEIVAAGLNIANYFNSKHKSTQYATMYAEKNITSDYNKIYGDAMKETSAWNGNDTSTIIELIARGGNGKIVGDNTGVFSYYNKNYVGEDSVTFRPVLIVEYESDNSDFIQTETLASKITAENYGDKVNYAANGVTDWRVFYNDGTNVFLIASDYLENSKVPENVDVQCEGEYAVYWNRNTILNELQKMSQLSLFKATGYNLNSDYYNSVCASKLLDTSIWKDFIDTEGKAIYSIGAPTLEMWLASWNEKYDDTLAFGTDEYGYTVGIDSNSLSDYIDGPTIIQQRRGYIEAINNYTATGGAEGGYGNIYYPHPDSNRTAWNECLGYWLASPSSLYDQLMYVGCHGSISRRNMFTDNSNEFCVRPVVCLSSSVNGTKNGDTWTLIN